jgi:hypothetical protein
MDDPEINRRFDELTEKLNKVETLSRDTHDCVIRLETRMGHLAEPGECSHCQSHLARLQKVEENLGALQTKFWFAYGGALVLLACAQYIISHILKN